MSTEFLDRKRLLTLIAFMEDRNYKFSPRFLEVCRHQVYIKSVLEQKTYYAEILTPKFAKAFWGDVAPGMVVQTVHVPGTYTVLKVLSPTTVQTNWSGENPNGQLVTDLIYDTPAWVQHLQQLVLNPNPLDYICKFINE